jgi:hypothetical protein
MIFTTIALFSAVSAGNVDPRDVFSPVEFAYVGKQACLKTQGGTTEIQSFCNSITQEAIQPINDVRVQNDVNILQSRDDLLNLARSKCDDLESMPGEVRLFRKNNCIFAKRNMPGQQVISDLCVSLRADTSEFCNDMMDPNAILRKRHLLKTINK